MAIRHGVFLLAVILTAAGAAAQDDVRGDDGSRGDLPFGDDYKPTNEREQRCQDGDYRTCFEIAENYRFGHGVPPMSWYCTGLYKAACVRKHALACFRLGQLLQGGEGVPPDEQASGRYFAAACEMGFQPACPPKAVTPEAPDGGVDEPDVVYPSSVTDRRGRYWEAASLCESGNMPACIEENQIVASLPENEIMGKRALRHCSIAYDSGLREGCAKDFVALKTVAAKLFGGHNCDKFILGYDGRPIYRCTPRPGTMRNGLAQTGPVDLYPIARGNYLAPDVENVIVEVYDSNRCNAEGYSYLALASWVGGQWEVTKKFDWAGNEYSGISVENVRMADGTDRILACEYFHQTGNYEDTCYVLNLADSNKRPKFLFSTGGYDSGSCTGRKWSGYYLDTRLEEPRDPGNEIKDVNGDGFPDVVIRYGKITRLCASGQIDYDNETVEPGEIILVSDGKDFSIQGKPPKEITPKVTWCKGWTAAEARAAARAKKATWVTRAGLFWGEDPGWDRTKNVWRDEVQQPGTQSLYWLRCRLGRQWSGGMCRGSSRGFRWDEARKACPDGYRLPSRLELISLLETCQSQVFKGKRGQCLSCAARDNSCRELFPNDWDWAWSSDAAGSSSAWAVYFNNGDVTTLSKTNTVPVLCVRGQY